MFQARINWTLELVVMPRCFPLAGLGFVFWIGGGGRVFSFVFVCLFLYFAFDYCGQDGIYTYFRNSNYYSLWENRLTKLFKITGSRYNVVSRSPWKAACLNNVAVCNVLELLIRRKGEFLKYENDSSRHLCTGLCD